MESHHHQLNTFLLQEEIILLNSQTHKSTNFQSTKKLRQIIISLFIITFLLYRFLYQSSLQPGQCIIDLTHQWTQFINAKLNQDGDFAYFFMIIGQLFVDIQLMIFIIFQIFKMENFFISVFIGIFYGIRGIFLNIEKFPYPDNVYWDQPGFPPSIGVPYGVTSDYFYSGHTGMMLFSLLFWSQKQQTIFLKYISMIGFPYIMLLVISSRVHYVVDVFAAIFFCFWVYRFSKSNLIFFDKVLSKGYLTSLCILQHFDKMLIFVLRLKKNNKKSTQKILV